jgi:hypothetical protein
MWMDLDVCGRVLQLPLTALGMRQRGSPQAASADYGTAIKSLKTWLEETRPLKTATLWLDSGTPSPTLRLEIGEAKQ